MHRMKRTRDLTATGRDLIHAAEAGDIGLVLDLIGQGVDINSYNKDK